MQWDVQMSIQLYAFYSVHFETIYFSVNFFLEIISKRHFLMITLFYQIKTSIDFFGIDGD